MPQSGKSVMNKKETIKIFKKNPAITATISLMIIIDFLINTLSHSENGNSNQPNLHRYNQVHFLAKKRKVVS